MSQKTCKNCGKTMVLKTGKYGKFWGCIGFPYCKTNEKYIPEVITKVKSAFEFIPTDEQNDIKQFFTENMKKQEKINLLVKASAGTGKSSTMAWILNTLDFTGFKVLIMSFNTSARDSLLAKITNPQIEVLTLNQKFLRDSKKVYPSAKIDESKYKDIILNCGLIAEDERKSYVNPISAIINALNANNLSITNDNVNIVLEKYTNIEIDYNSSVLAVIQYTNEQIIKQYDSLVSFDDTVRISAINAAFCSKYDILIIDECQDTTILNQIALYNAINKNGFCVFIGDERQSINGFRYADTNAISNIIGKFKPAILPLTLTHRCPANHISYVKSAHPDYDIKSNKKDGIMDYIKEENLINSITSDTTALILCRNNAPLIKPAFNMIRSGFKVSIKGKDLINDLLSMIDGTTKKYSCKDISELLTGLNKNYNELFIKFQNAKNKGFLDIMLDKIQTIEALAEYSESIVDIKNNIAKIFMDETNQTDYIFSTVHKSKGEESKNIYILYPELLMSKKAVTDEQIRQEENIWIVAHTRSKENLYFVNKQS